MTSTGNKKAIMAPKRTASIELQCLWSALGRVSFYGVASLLYSVDV